MYLEGKKIDILAHVKWLCRVLCQKVYRVHIVYTVKERNETKIIMRSILDKLLHHL